MAIRIPALRNMVIVIDFTSHFEELNEISPQKSVRTDVGPETNVLQLKGNLFGPSDPTLWLETVWVAMSCSIRFDNLQKGDCSMGEIGLTPIHQAQFPLRL